MSISKELYTQARNAWHGNATGFSDGEIGFIGFCASYNGKFFNGYSGYLTNNNISRNYIKEAENNITKQLPNLRGVDFVCSDYSSLEIPPHSIIYCDPPYRSTTGYIKSIDYEHFYDWCRKMQSAGHKVFVSEYDMPDDFICVWEKQSATQCVIIRQNNQLKNCLHSKKT